MRVLFLTAILMISACVSSGPDDLAPDQIAALGLLLKGERP